MATEVNTTFNPYTMQYDYTYSFSKYSCWKYAYPLHIGLAYVIVLSGFFALISRIFTSLKPYHVWFGRIYMIAMYWCMASSLLIHNTGLPMPILVFFVFLLGGLGIGWIAIKIHSSQMEELALKRVESVIQKQGLVGDLSTLKQQELENVANGKTFVQRLFSFKALHGMMMAFSWYQMFGRSIITNPSKWDGCHTYPAFKLHNETEQVQFVPAEDPNYGIGKIGEWNFISMVSLPAVFLILLVGAGWSFWEGRKAMQMNGDKEESLLAPPMMNRKVSANF